MQRIKVKRKNPLRKQESRKDRFFRYSGLILGGLAGLLGIYFNSVADRNSVMSLVLNILIVLAAILALKKVGLAAVALIMLGLITSLGQGQVIGVLAIFAAIVLLLGADVRNDKL